MVVGVGIGDRELDRNHVEEGRLREVRAFRAEVDGRCEREAVATRVERVAFEQRRGGATVGVQDGRQQDDCDGIQAGQRDSDPGGRAAVRSVEDVGGELADDDDQGRGVGFSGCRDDKVYLLFPAWIARGWSSFGSPLSRASLQRSAKWSQGGCRLARL